MSAPALGAASPLLSFCAADTEAATLAAAELTSRYGCVAPEDADFVVALGGDGFLLKTLHRHLDRRTPIYGMHRGTVGFLMNAYRSEDLPARLAAAQRVAIHPLEMTATDAGGQRHIGRAINEVALFRSGPQAAKLRVSVDGIVRLDELIGDGVLVATPLGSTAYNLSAHGPIIPLGAPILALTPVSAFRPRRWRGALLPHAVRIDVEILEPAKRPVSATADFVEVRNVLHVAIAETRDVAATLLFDPEHNLEERVFAEQFSS